MTQSNQKTPFNVDELREHLRKISDPELHKFGQAAPHMVTPKANPRPTASGRVRDSTGRGTKRMEAKKEPAKNDKADRNINDFAVDLMAAQRSCPICKRPLWKEKYDAVVKGHLSMDLEIEIAPGGDHPPGVLYFSRGCASGLFRLLTATPLSSCRPPIISGAFLFLGSHQIQAARTNRLCWQSANLGQLDVYISKFLDSFPAGEKGLPVLPHLKAEHHELHL
jgi:hypothetical protein